MRRIVLAILVVAGVARGSFLEKPEVATKAAAASTKQSTVKGSKSTVAAAVPAKATVTSPKQGADVPLAALAVSAIHKQLKPTTVHEHALAAQNSADEAARHLAKAQAAFK